MIYPSRDEMEKHMDSKYSLVIAVSKRAKQLKEGAPKLIDTKSTNPITIALEEIAAGKLRIVEPSLEQMEAQARAKAGADVRDTTARLVVPTLADLDEEDVEILDHSGVADDVEEEEEEEQETLFPLGIEGEVVTEDIVLDDEDDSAEPDLLAEEQEDI